MVRQAAGQDIREYVGGRIFGSRIDMHCRSYPGIGHLVCVQEASGTVHAFAQEYLLYSGGGYHLWSGFCGKNCRCACPDGLSGGGAFALSADAENSSAMENV